MFVARAIWCEMNTLISVQIQELFFSLYLKLCDLVFFFFYIFTIFTDNNSEIMMKNNIFMDQIFMSVCNLLPLD